jgi:hypothetical protein
MCFKKNNSKTQSKVESNDIDLVSDENLDRVSGAGNPWEKVKGVPQEPIDKELRDKA